MVGVLEALDSTWLGFLVHSPGYWLVFLPPFLCFTTERAYRTLDIVAILDVGNELKEVIRLLIPACLTNRNGLNVQVCSKKSVGALEEDAGA